MATEFRILGPLEVIEDGTVLELGAQKQRTVLAVLLLHANAVVSTDRLIDAVWEDDPPARADKALQVYVSHLRKVVGKERLLTRAPGYVLTVADGELDLSRFESLLSDGRPRDALALWRGPPLADVGYSRFAQPAIARLEELRVAALEACLDEDLAAGRYTQLIGELDRLVREYPSRERLREQLMLALYRGGRQADALEVYQQGRRLLSDELGLEPGEALKDLQRAILAHDPSLEASVSVDVPGDADRSVFVGREAELDQLLSLLDEAQAGRGRIALLVGEPGIGKSRLADEVMNTARARGAVVLIGRCWEAGGAPAYWPWVQSLRALVRETRADLLREQIRSGAAELAQLVPEIGELVPVERDQPTLDAGSARFRLFEAVSSFLSAAARSRSLVLVLDDLHAADEPSLLMLQFVARELRDSRLLVIGAYRNVDPTPSDPLTSALTELGREPVTRSIVLAGLVEADVGRYFELTTGEAPSAELVAAVSEETDGNPLFLGEIVRLLVAEGGFMTQETPRLAIPQTVRDVIARRVRRLSEESGRVLVLASVLGREFSVDALASIAGISDDDLLDTLDEAMLERVVTDVPGSPGHLRFAHVLIRDTLYEELTTARRVRLHRMVLGTLEALYGDEPGAHLAELAYHAIAGSDFDRGVRYARRAGDRALELLAYEESARLFSTALDALDVSSPEDGRTRCDLLLALGEAEARAGNSSAARRAFSDAAEFARQLGLRRELARAAAGYGGRIVWGRTGADTQLVPFLEEGLAAVADDDIELRARLLARLSGALRDEHSRVRRDRVSSEAVELARHTGELSALAYALDGRAAAINAPDTIDECLVLGTELCEVASRIGDGERVVYGHIHRFIAELNLGRVAEAEADLAAASIIADELRQPTLRWQVGGGKAMIALAVGNFAESEDLIARALTFGERAHDWLAVPVYSLQLYALCDFRGEDLGPFEKKIEGLAAQYPARPMLLCALAHLQARLMRYEDARTILDRLAADEFSALPFDMEWLFATSLLAETCAILGAREPATTLLELMRPWDALNVMDMAEGIRGSTARYLGLLATTAERFDEAESHFERALEMNERMGARPWLAHTQEDYGRMLTENGDEARGRLLAEQAVAAYRDLGMDGPLARAAAVTEV